MDWELTSVSHSSHDDSHDMWLDSSLARWLAVCQDPLGTAVQRKAPITPRLLLRIVHLFAFAKPLHVAMWAPFLVAFHSFLRKSNLFVDRAAQVSPKVLLRSALCFDASFAYPTVRASKTIQFQERLFSLPLPRIPGSLLCPVAALVNHLRINQVPQDMPLFSVRDGPLEKLWWAWGLFEPQEFFLLSNSLYEFFLGRSMNIF